MVIKFNNEANWGAGVGEGVDIMKQLALICRAIRLVSLFLFVLGCRCLGLFPALCSVIISGWGGGPETVLKIEPASAVSKINA